MSDDTENPVDAAFRKVRDARDADRSEVNAAVFEDEFHRAREIVRACPSCGQGDRTLKPEDALPDSPPCRDAWHRQAWPDHAKGVYTDGGLSWIPPSIATLSHIRVPRDAVEDPPNVLRSLGMAAWHRPEGGVTMDDGTGRYVAAEPIPMQGWAAKTEAWARARGWHRLAGLLARYDERNLGR